MIAFEAAVFGGAALLGYGLSGALYLAFLAWRRVGVVAAALGLLTAAWIAHAAALSCRLIESGRLPIASVAETLGLYAFLLGAGAIAAHRRLGQPVFGAALVPLAFGAAVLGAWPRGHNPIAPVLESAWLPLHVLTSFLAYAALTLAFAAAILHLIAFSRLKRKSRAALDTLLPPLQTSERLTFRLIALGFPLLTLAIVSGALWAAGAWGSPWRWDPKETMALATWLVWGGCVFARYAGWSARRAAWLVVAGFLSTAVLFLGVGLVAPGRHDFGV